MDPLALTPPLGWPLSVYTMGGQEIVVQVRSRHKVIYVIEKVALAMRLPWVVWENVNLVVGGQVMDRYQKIGAYLAVFAVNDEPPVLNVHVSQPH